MTTRTKKQVDVNLPDQKKDERGPGSVLFIDKPLEWTSFDVVRAIRRILNIRKVGHSGTLDPKATGLLIVCTGEQTKNIDQFMGLEKEYVGMLELGVQTPSFDSETEVSERLDFARIALNEVRDAARTFLGRQQQTPPMYSAVKYGGKPLYKYARKGRTVQRSDKEIEITDFEITRFDSPYVEFRLVCSKGTYVRSVVNDLGQRLGCGATLRSLRRTRIGEHLVANALTMDQLAKSNTEAKQRSFPEHARRPA